MSHIGKLKKEVGHPKHESPLTQAFRLKEMLKRLLGNSKGPLSPDEHVRRTVGRT